MNIGHLLRSILGDVQPAEGKTLELKVGQVVRGVVLQLLEDQDALVNIGGMLVKARLQAPLKQGEATFLQVQPESGDGQIVLKPVSQAAVPIPQESLANLLQNFGLKDQPANRQLILQMHQNGVPLTKDNARQLAQVMSFAAAKAAPEEWIQAAIVAFGRNLPLTEETVGAIRQTLQGKPLLQMAEQLGRQIGEWLRTGSAPATITRVLQQASGMLGSLSDAARQAVQAEAAVLPPPADAFSVSAGGELALEAAKPPAHFASPASEAGRVASAPAADSSLPAEAGPGGSAAPAVQGDTPPADADAAKAGGGKLADDGQRSLLQRDTNSASPPPSVSAAQSGAAVQHQAAIARSDRTAGPSEAEGTDVSAPAGRTPEPLASGQLPPAAGASSQDGASAIVKWLHLLGFEHEKQVARLPANPLSDPMAAGGETAPLPDGKAADVQQTLKSVLLQLATTDDVPGSIKDVAQQMAQQITGQQLLLTPDRASLFSHVTMFVPLVNDQGRQTAAVHIQSRKGRRGEIDSSNCRLLFDLNMASLGSTLVDVQVVDRIVSVQVHNDHPHIADVLESYREEMAEALQQIGYKFISLKCAPFPQPSSDEVKEEGHASADAQRWNVSLLLQPQPYKSVDVRI